MTTHNDTTLGAFTKRDEFNQQLEAARNGRKYYTVKVGAHPDCESCWGDGYFADWTGCGDAAGGYAETCSDCSGSGWKRRVKRHERDFEAFKRETGVG